MNFRKIYSLIKSVPDLKENITVLYRDDLIKKTVSIFVVISLLFIVICLFNYKKLPPEIPIYYSQPRGSEQLGNPASIYILPISSVLIFIINFLVAGKINHEELLIARILVMLGLIPAILMLITLIKIISLIN